MLMHRCDAGVALKQPWFNVWCLLLYVYDYTGLVSLRADHMFTACRSVKIQTGE